MDNFEIHNHSGNIDEIIEIPSNLEKEYKIRRRNSIVGPYDYIKRKFHEKPITEGWWQYSVALKESGAMVAPRYKTPMVNTDVIPIELAQCVLEHEIVESTLDSDPSEGHSQIAINALRKLGLMINLDNVSHPRFNHAFAVVHQLRMAQKEGHLDEMMKFMDGLESRGENTVYSFGNKDFRNAVSKMLKEKY